MAEYAASTQQRFWVGQHMKLRLEGLEDSKTPISREHFMRYLQQIMLGLGRALTVRQQVLATAQACILRFFSKVDLRKTNVYVLTAAAISIAGKIEESPVYIRTIADTAAKLFPGRVTTDLSKIAEYEFRIASELNGQLYFHHPYEYLDSTAAKIVLSAEEKSAAFLVINDSYATATPVTYDPIIIATAAVLLVLSALGPAVQEQTDGEGTGATKRREALMDVIGSSEMSMEALVECTQALLSHYGSLESYDELATREQVQALNKLWMSKQAQK